MAFKTAKDISNAAPTFVHTSNIQWTPIDQMPAIESMWDVHDENQHNLTRDLATKCGIFENIHTLRILVFCNKKRLPSGLKVDINNIGLRILTHYMFIKSDDTWDDAKKRIGMILNKFGAMTYNRQTDDIAFMRTIAYTKNTRVLDTTTGNPYDVLGDHTTWFIGLVSHKPDIWIPKIMIFDACNECGKTNGLKSCARCYNVKYCSKECQKAAWCEHKSHCKKSE
jgi:hypothetical protein